MGLLKLQIAEDVMCNYVRIRKYTKQLSYNSYNYSSYNLVYSNLANVYLLKNISSTKTNIFVNIFFFFFGLETTIILILSWYKIELLVLTRCVIQ